MNWLCKIQLTGQTENCMHTNTVMRWGNCVEEIYFSRDLLTKAAFIWLEVQ